MVKFKNNKPNHEKLTQNTSGINRFTGISINPPNGSEKVTEEDKGNCYQ
jgi:hypothetical protein